MLLCWVRNSQVVQVSARVRTTQVFASEPCTRERSKNPTLWSDPHHPVCEGSRVSSTRVGFGISLRASNTGRAHQYLPLRQEAELLPHRVELPVSGVGRSHISCQDLRGDTKLKIPVSPS